MNSSVIWGFSFVVLAVSCLLKYLRQRRDTDNYFPSPPSEPILGHLRAFSQYFPWITFLTWKKQYGEDQDCLRTVQGLTLSRNEGDIIQLFVFNKSIIVLNNAQDAQNLLEKRGHNYSDRVRAILQGEM